MISPDFLDELDQFETALKRRVHAVFAGEQTTREVGEGLTFSDYRRYAPGDDVRLIDWKLFGRTDELFVRQFERERNLTVHVLLDASESMAFGDGDANKFEFAAKLGLGFAYLTARENNDFRFCVFGEEVTRLDARRSTRGEVLRLVDRVNDLEPRGETDFASALAAYADGIATRSLVLVASDFLADPGDVGAGLDALDRNDLTLAHVVAPAEVDLPARGDTIFTDSETDARLRTYLGGRVERAYRRRLDAHLAAVAAEGSERGARYELANTGDDFFDAFASVWFE